jgi:hypothetical protein
MVSSSRNTFIYPLLTLLPYRHYLHMSKYGTDSHKESMPIEHARTLLGIAEAVRREGDKGSISR